MFGIDGKTSDVGNVASAILEASGLFDEHDDAPLTCVVYREDPIHRYLFVTAHASLRQPEPMYGPVVEDDRRKRRSRKPRQRAIAGPTTGSILGFASRENIADGGVRLLPEDNLWVTKRRWQIWLSRRRAEGESDEKENQERAREFEAKVLPPLKIQLDSATDDSPLFPELWYHERRARDSFHNAFRDLPPGASLEEVGRNLADRLQKSLSENAINLSCDVGIYLDTGENWTLLGDEGYRGRLPHKVTEGYDHVRLCNTELATKAEELNAFAWVHRSTRPVLLSNDISPVWQQRLARTGHEFSDQVAGICLVPLLDLNDPSRSMGVILLTAMEQSELLPSHLFLLSRLSISLSAHLGPLLPLPGFPWWPEVRLGRGGARQKVDWEDAPSDRSALADEKLSIDEIIGEVTPTGSSVDVRVLQPGLSGAKVFVLKIKDSGGLIEVPRVLKIGDEDSISKELKAYYQFVHNKRIGAECRVDRTLLPKADSHAGKQPGGSPRKGVIVYTLVGAGDDAAAWLEWARTASKNAVENGLEDLRKQLNYWYSSATSDSTSAVELLVKWRRDRLREKQPELDWAESPTIDEVIDQLDRVIANEGRGASPISTCVVHGDLHSRNIFTLSVEDIGANGAARGKRRQKVRVAVIDWGLVEEGGHPLNDIALLAADVVYKVRFERNYPTREQLDGDWALRQVQSWARKLPVDNEKDPYLALIDKVAKMLFWKDYLTDSAREQAWRDLQAWAAALAASRKRRSGKSARR